MEIRRAAPEDFAGILELQSANYLENLSAGERQGGFLSVAFTRAQIATLAGDLGVMVASEHGRIVGYLCAHRTDLAEPPAIVKSLLRSVRMASWRGRPLADAALFVYGPVCIARTHRGRGLLRALYRALLAEVTGKFSFGVTFVSQDNPHSLRAHIEGLGMDEVQLFEHGGRRYHLLVFAAR